VNTSVDLKTLRPPLFALVYVVVCCSVLQCVAVCCSVLQCVAASVVRTGICCSVLHCVCVFVAASRGAHEPSCAQEHWYLLQRVALCLRVCCSVKSCTRTLLCTRALQRVHRLHKSVLKCIAVCCSVLQCVRQCVHHTFAQEHSAVSRVTRECHECHSLCLLQSQECVLQCVAVCCRVKRQWHECHACAQDALMTLMSAQEQCVCCSVLQCVAVSRDSGMSVTRVHELHKSVKNASRAVCVLRVTSVSLTTRNTHTALVLS